MVLLSPVQYLLYTPNFRRVCPGKHLALANLWAVISTVLATLQIGKARNETGCEITPRGEFNIGFTRYVATGKSRGY